MHLSYLLYNVFENGVDDGGDDFRGEVIGGEWDDGSADEGRTDFVIRLPTPAIELGI